MSDELDLGFSKRESIELIKEALEELRQVWEEEP